MLSFKQYLQSDRYRDHQAKTQQRTLPRTKPIKESKRESGEIMPKWELIRMIAEDPSEVVQVGFGEGAVVFAFVDIDKSASPSS